MMGMRDRWLVPQSSAVTYWLAAFQLLRTMQTSPVTPQVRPLYRVQLVKKIMTLWRSFVCGRFPT